MLSKLSAHGSPHLRVKVGVVVLVALGVTVLVALGVTVLVGL